MGRVQRAGLAAEKALREIIGIPEVEVATCGPSMLRIRKKCPFGTVKVAASRGETITSSTFVNVPRAAYKVSMSGAGRVPFG